VEGGTPSARGGNTCCTRDSPPCIRGCAGCHSTAAATPATTPGWILMANLTGGREGPLRAECRAVMGVRSLHKQRSCTPPGRRALSTSHSVPPHSRRGSCNQSNGDQPRVPWTHASTTVHMTGPARHSIHSEHSSCTDACWPGPCPGQPRVSHERSSKQASQVRDTIPASHRQLRSLADRLQLLRERRRAGASTMPDRMMTVYWIQNTVTCLPPLSPA
jgi:hypothetical protein